MVETDHPPRWNAKNPKSYFRANQGNLPGMRSDRIPIRTNPTFFYRNLAPFLFLRSVSAEVSAVSAEVSAVSAESCLQRFVSAANF